MVKSWDPVSGSEVSTWHLTHTEFKLANGNIDATTLLSNVAADSQTTLTYCSIDEQRNELNPDLTDYGAEPSTSPSEFDAGYTADTTGTMTVQASGLLDIYPCD